MSKLYNINSAYSLVDSLYGIEIDPNSFEDIAIEGWELIGNKHTRLYRYIGDTENGELELPCNVDFIESVHIPITDAQVTSNRTDFFDTNSVLIEKYIDLWKGLDDPFNSKGKYVKYKEGNNTLYFNRDYKHIKVVYHGVIVDDEDGLPLLNEKELRAVAAFVAYRETFKEGLRKKDINTIKLAKEIESEWLKRCSAARIPEHLTQNDMDKILDVKYRWDRKQYGKSHEPIL